MNAIQAGVVALFGLFDTTAALAAQGGACKRYEHWVGQRKVNIVDFRGGDATSPFRFRLEVHGFEAVKSDGFMGPIPRGEVACNVFEVHWKEPRKGNTFGWFNLCGKTAQSREGHRAWERLGFLVHEAR